MLIDCSNGRGSFALLPQRQLKYITDSRWTPGLMVGRRFILRFHDPVLSIHAVGLAAWNKQTIKAYEISGSAIDPTAQVTNNILTVKELLSPLSREEMKIVRCLGLNYSDHAVSPLSEICAMILTKT
jgi:hypothetical protein